MLVFFLLYRFIMTTICTVLRESVYDTYRSHSVYE